MDDAPVMLTQMARYGIGIFVESMRLLVRNGVLVAKLSQQADPAAGGVRENLLLQALCHLRSLILMTLANTGEKAQAPVLTILTN